MMFTRCMNAVVCGVILGALALCHVDGLVEPIPMPDVLESCYKQKTYNVSITTIPALDINIFCIKYYLYQTASTRYYRPISNETISYARELFRQVLGKAHVHRHKRQAGGFRRREIRMLTPFQRNAIFSRINALKNTPGPGGLNRYDSLADIHRLVSIQNSAHTGPNFLGWHRIYLLILEQALQLPIPYWDSRLDFYMEDPTDSLLWTPDFVGNGFGDVETGPFAFWRTPAGPNLWIPLTRNIGNGGTLLTDDAVDAVLSRNFHSEILEPTQTQFSLEAYHNGPHAWVDGQLSAFETAAQDPLFFMHHAFVDYIWSQFRNKIRSQGRDPQAGYPSSTIPRQQAMDRMIPFNLRNVHGFANYFDSLVNYESPPACPSCGGGNYLECVEGRCRSRVALVPVTGTPAGARGFGPASGGFARAGSVGRERARQSVARMGSLPIGRKFVSPLVDPRTRGDTLPNSPSPRSRIRRHAHVDRNVTMTNNGKMSTHFQDSSHLDHSYQNTFILDGVSDINRWVFLPVRIVYERPPEAKFDSYIIKDGQLVKDTQNGTDNHDGLRVSMKTKRQAVYPKCKVSGSGASKLFVQTDGINYAGRYKEYAIIDERLAVSSAMTYVGVKNPNTGTSKAYISAYDTCGRVCEAHCLLNGSYKPCSGAVRITTEGPKMYGMSREDAVKTVWKSKSSIMSEPFSDQVPIAFICENRTTWPWFSHQ